MAQLQRSHQSPVSRQSGTGTASAANIAVGDPLVSEPTIGQKPAAGESLVAMPSLHNVACEGKYWHIALASGGRFRITPSADRPLDLSRSANPTPIDLPIPSTWLCSISALAGFVRSPFVREVRQRSCLPRPLLTSPPR